MATCELCGGNAGQLNAQGQHNLCTARKEQGLPTPSLGTRCEDCGGSGVKPKTQAGPMLSLDLGPAKIAQAIHAWAPKCPTCKGAGVQLRPCPWGGCNGTGLPGGRCDRCGTPVDFPYDGGGGR